jgi:hypothetical protein
MKENLKTVSSMEKVLLFIGMARVNMKENGSIIR